MSIERITALPFGIIIILYIIWVFWLYLRHVQKRKENLKVQQKIIDSIVYKGKKQWIPSYETALKIYKHFSSGGDSTLEVIPNFFEKEGVQDFLREHRIHGYVVVQKDLTKAEAHTGCIPPLFIKFFYPIEAQLIYDEFFTFVIRRDPLSIDTTNLLPEEIPVRL